MRVGEVHPSRGVEGVDDRGDGASRERGLVGADAGDPRPSDDSTPGEVVLRGTRVQWCVL